MWSDLINVKWFYFKVKWSEVSEVNWNEVTEVKWNEVSYDDVLVDKVAMYIRVTLYCGRLIILWLFHLGISCTVLVLICTVVGFYIVL
jgi:hypothetical protein